MIRSLSLRRAAAAATAAGLALLLAACFVLPGKFASTLDIPRTGISLTPTRVNLC